MTAIVIEFVNLMEGISIEGSYAIIFIYAGFNSSHLHEFNKYIIVMFK